VEVDEDEDVVTDGTVTYIDPLFAYVIIDDQEIDIIGSAKEFFNNDAIAIGDKIAFELSAGNKMFKITAIEPASGTVTMDSDDVYAAFEGLAIAGNLTINSVTTAGDANVIRATNVTVTKNLEVSGDANLAATEFDVKGTTDVTSTGTVTFTNVTFGDDVSIDTVATIKNSTIAGDFDAKGKAVTLEGSVTVKGAIKDAANVVVTDADQATKDAVQDAKDEAAHADKLNSTSMTNFNTHSGEDYKGVNIGFTLQDGIDFDKISSIKVNLYSTEGTLIASNVAIKNKIKDLYTAQTPVREFSTAFIAVDGTYKEEYWTLGAWTAKANVKPGKAELVIVDSKGNEYKKVNNSLSEATATWSSLFPPAGEIKKTAYWGIPDNVLYYFEFELGNEFKIGELTSLVAKAYDGENLLSTISLKDDKFTDYADLTSLGGSFRSNPEASPSSSWNLEAFDGTMPTEIVVEYVKGSKTYTFGIQEIVWINEGYVE